VIKSEISASDLLAALSVKIKTTETTTPKVLFTTMSGATLAKPDTNAEKSVYVPQSLLFDFQKVICDQDAKLANMMPTSSFFERKVRELGINQGDSLVIYDDFGNFCASRVWFMFKAMGHDNVKVLSGGLPQWLAMNFPVQADLTTASVMGDFIAKPDKNYQFVDCEFIASNVSTNNGEKFTLLDARSSQRFSAQEAEVRPNLRSGHIPNSVNVYYKDIQNEISSFADFDYLREAFQRATGKLDLGALAFSCGSGVTACILAQAADALGYRPLYVYDGSWSDWGARSELPLETGHSRGD
jgi:thiosulfate/3-mercaptopyruvate sulfurtransferase